MAKLHWTMGNTVPPVDMKRPRTFWSVTLKDNVLTATVQRGSVRLVHATFS